jgi:predicted GNAT superfamily acetyltransferase
MMEIRPILTLDECRQVVALEKDVWAYADAEDLVPSALLIVGVKRGAILLGAFHPASAMKGFVYSFPAVKDGRLTQWSHMLGVSPDARDAGLGRRLKLAQRARAIEMGVELIEWTFDPLQAVNAHLNFARLGVVAEEYEENIYGGSTSPLHGGTPTDRLIASWRLTAPHVERRIASEGVALVRDASIRDAPLANPSGSSRAGLAPGAADLTLDAPRLLIEIPVGFSEIQANDPPLAVQWRLATRRLFQHYLSRGYRAVDFFLSRQSGRGHYLLAQTPKSPG